MVSTWALSLLSLVWGLKLWGFTAEPCRAVEAEPQPVFTSRSLQLLTFNISWQTAQWGEEWNLNNINCLSVHVSMVPRCKRKWYRWTVSALVTWTISTPAFLGEVLNEAVVRTRLKVSEWPGHVLYLTGFFSQAPGSSVYLGSCPFLVAMVISPVDAWSQCHSLSMISIVSSVSTASCDWGPQNHGNPFVCRGSRGVW